MERRGFSWDFDNVVMTTVGVDIGSSTSHLTFSRVWLQREIQLLSSRFVVLKRETLYRSPVMLTPYIEHGQIDAKELARFIADAYVAANIRRQDVDSGAVILTGVALARSNSRAIAEMFAEDGGRFVCASAGHILEAILAAHGSGAVEMSQQRHETILNIDVGGGTTKLALIVDGAIEATMAVGIGARLILFDETGRVQHVEPHGAVLAQRARVALVFGERVGAEERRRIAAVMASSIIAAARGELTSSDRKDLLLAGTMPRYSAVTSITFSGGVSEFIDGKTTEDFNDLAPELADALRMRFRELPGAVVASHERIRATVVGASQYSMQLSGNTVYVSDPARLPLHNIPVVRFAIGSRGDWSAGSISTAIRREAALLGIDAHEGPVGIAVAGPIEPDYRTVRSLAEGLLEFHTAASSSALPMIIALQGDLAATLGRILADDIGTKVQLIVLDGLELEALDYMDIGQVLMPSNAIPVVIKSLLFPKAVPEVVKGGSGDGR